MQSQVVICRSETERELKRKALMENIKAWAGEGDDFCLSMLGLRPWAGFAFPGVMWKEVSKR